MKEILKSKSTRLIAAFMAVVMIAAMLPATAFAWSAEEGTECTSKKGERYVGSDDAYFYSKAGNVMFYDDDGSFHIEHRNGGKAKRKYLMVDDSGSEHHVYCVEAGIDYPNNDAYSSTSGKNSRYFQNLPATAQYGIMLALMYGWHEGMNSPVSGTNNDDFAFATQVIIWEYQQQIRTSPTHLAANNGIDADKYNHTIIGRPAEQCYNWILDQMSKHCIVPSFASRSQGDAKTYTMKYDAGKSEYSITLTDTNNTLADIKFSANGITVSRNENRYTFTSKNMITDAVMISAQKKTNLGMGSMLIWGCPGKQTMASGAEDPVFFYLKLKTEAKGVGQIVKTSEDGSVEGIKFTIKGNGVNETVTTGKDGTVDTQITLFGGFAPNSSSADTLSKALGSRTVMSGSVSRSKNDPSESLQMMERPLLTPDELKSLPKGDFVVMKTGVHPMRVHLKLFFKWGIEFDKDRPYTVAENGNRKVQYASKTELMDGIVKKYHPEAVLEGDVTGEGGEMVEPKQPEAKNHQTPKGNRNRSRQPKPLPDQAEKDGKKSGSQPSEKQVIFETEPEPMLQEVTDEQA